jgi:hypothetical protein
MGTDGDKVRDDQREGVEAGIPGNADAARKVGGSTPTPAVPDESVSNGDAADRDAKTRRTGLPGG